jgi:hypothetical protein
MKLQKFFPQGICHPALMLLMSFSLISCAGFINSSTICDSLGAMFSSLGKALCQSIIAPADTSNKSLALAPSTGRIISGNDTLWYETTTEKWGNSDISFHTSNGITGKIALSKALLVHR